MREIKFDLIYQGETAFHHKKYYLCELMGGINKICDIHHMMRLVAKRQYIGLKDINGVEIYEGDIVKSLGVSDYCFGVRPVEYINSSFTVKGYGLLERLVEVIGNIYENPELLESKND